MAAYVTQEHMVIGYKNRVRNENISSIAVAGFTPVINFPANNLKYEDPYRIMKVTATPSSNPTITYTFNSSQTFDCWGLMRHTMRSTATGARVVNLQYENVGWNDVGTGILLTSSLNTDMDFLLRFQPQASTQWRIDTVGLYPFQIGSVFMGTYLEMTKNIEEGAYESRMAGQYTTQKTFGGAKHVVGTATKPSHDTRFGFRRVGIVQAGFWNETINTTEHGRIIGLVPPHESGSITPGSQEHFYGRLTEVRSRVRYGSTWDQTVVLEGI